MGRTKIPKLDHDDPEAGHKADREYDREDAIKKDISIEQAYERFGEPDADHAG